VRSYHRKPLDDFVALKKRESESQHAPTNMNDLGNGDKLHLQTATSKWEGESRTTALPLPTQTYN